MSNSKTTEAAQGARDASSGHSMASQAHATHVFEADAGRTSAGVAGSPERSVDAAARTTADLQLCAGIVSNSMMEVSKRVVKSALLGDGCTQIAVAG